MREKLIELFYENNVRCDQKIEGLADDVMDIIANGVTIQKWIRVTEQLPEGECLAVSMRNGHSYKEMLVGYVYADGYSDTLYTAESDGEILKNITHWMPLPEPPKGE